MTNTSGGLDELRERLSATDRELLNLVARRQAIVAEIGHLKVEAGLPTRDFAREREVLLGVREIAREMSVPTDLAESLFRQLIRSSLTTQEQAKVVAGGYGSGKRALVIGGTGKMGRWFVEFLASQAFAVEVADPAGRVPGFVHRDGWQHGAVDHDVIVVATPLRIAARLLRELALRKPTGLVFDIGSLKTPLREGLEALAEANCRVTSLHPMFGPDTELLSGRHVIFVDVGHAGATTEARDLFQPTMVKQVAMTLEEHDRVIAYVLGLSHALNIAFFTALGESGETVPKLAELSSTTFDAQLDVADRVALDNPHLYFEIQALNEYGDVALDSLERAIHSLRSLVAAGDESSFVELMQRGRDYLADRGADRGESRDRSPEVAG